MKFGFVGVGSTFTFTALSLHVRRRCLGATWLREVVVERTHPLC